VSDPSRCVVLVPIVNDALDPDCEKGLRELERRGYAVWKRPGASSAALRNQMASEALAQGFDELMWIDPRIVFDPNDVDRLRAHQLPIVAGLYPVIAARKFAAVFLPGTDLIRLGPAGGVIELRYCGFGFVLTRREVFESVQRRLTWPAGHEHSDAKLVPFFGPLVVPDGPTGPVCLEDDFGFQERARQCQYRIMVDLSFRLWHAGRHLYSWENAGGDPKRYLDYTYRIGPLPPAHEQAPAVPVPNSPPPPPPRNPFRGATNPLPAGFPRLSAYLVTYAANRASAEQTLDSFRASDWGAEPQVFVQPADWPVGRPSAAKNYKRLLEQAANDACDFALIVEDDVRVCRWLRHNLSKLPLVSRDQCDYLSLYVPDVIHSPWEREEPALGYRLAKPLYSGTNQMWQKFRIWGAQAYLLSRRFILAALERWDRLREGLDARVVSVCKELNLPMWYTAPCLVQHAPLRSAYATPPAYAPDFQADFRLKIGVEFQPPEEMPGWLTHEEGKLLWETAKGKAVLEVGTEFGRATVCLAQHARQVVSIDGQDQAEAREWVRRFDAANRVAFHRGHPSPTIGTLAHRFDLLFVNNERDATSLTQVIEAALPVLEPGGLVAFHNYPDPAWPDVRQVVDEHAQRLGWKRIAQIGYLGVFRTGFI
jgi:predicted O-methyltransferase YrrM